MKYRYFCSYHIEQMKICESTALKSWTEMMNHGIQAFAECRVEAAHTYLSSAFEVGILRSGCANNTIFGARYILKPAEFIIQLMVVDNQFSDAITLLSRLSSMDSQYLGDTGDEVSLFLEKEYERVELAEKEYLIRVSHPPANDAIVDYPFKSTYVFH